MADPIVLTFYYDGEQLRITEIDVDDWVEVQEYAGVDDLDGMQAAVQAGNMKVAKAMLWLARKQTQPDLKLADVRCNLLALIDPDTQDDADDDAAASDAEAETEADAGVEAAGAGSGKGA